MGLQHSKVRAQVDAVISAGMSVIVNTATSQNNKVSSDQSVICQDCDTCSIHGVFQGAWMRFDFEAVAKALVDSKVKADIEQAIQAEADLIAKGGIGGQVSDVQAIIKAKTEIAQKLVESATAAFSSETFLSQNVTCRNTKNAKMGWIVQTQVAKVLSRAVVENQMVNDMALKLQQELEATATAKVTGWDPVGSLAMLAIAAVVGFLLFAMAGPAVGMSVAKKIAASPYTWLAVTGALSLLCGFLASGEIFGYWPKQKIDNLDSADSAEKKKRINAGVGIAMGVGCVASAFGFAMLIKNKRV